ncbi:MAG: hypothetical protein V3G42_09295 [Oscillospiraceae bacterium]
MKKSLAVLLSCMMLFTGCSSNADVSFLSSENIETQITETETIQTDNVLSVDTQSEEYVATLGFTSLDDDNLMQYINDSIYSDLELNLQSDDYRIENISSTYLSKEYIEQLEYNSKENKFFGHTLSELDAQFQGQKYIFTLGDDGQTKVESFEEYDTTYEQALKKTAIGTGVILICVTVSVVSGGAGVPAVSAIFAASAKTATTMALSTGMISGVASGIVKGIETKDFDEALKAAADKGSEGFMWGAVSGAVIGAGSELFTVHNVGNIPNWRESEEFVFQEYSGNAEQIAFYGGEKVSVTFPNSTRPDVIRQVGDKLEAIEVKNYNLESNFSNLCRTLEKQIGDRVVNLPDNYTQRIVLDARNRGYTEEFLNQTASSLQKYLEPVYEEIPIDIITNIGDKIFTITV